MTKQKELTLNGNNSQVCASTLERGKVGEAVTPIRHFPEQEAQEQQKVYKFCL